MAKIIVNPLIQKAVVYRLQILYDKAKTDNEIYQKQLKSYNEQHWLVRWMFDPPNMQDNTFQIKRLLQLFCTDGWIEIHLEEWEWRIIHSYNAVTDRLL
jgi:hypothetical protein